MALSVSRLVGQLHPSLYRRLRELGGIGRAAGRRVAELGARREAVGPEVAECLRPPVHSPNQARITKPNYRGTTVPTVSTQACDARSEPLVTSRHLGPLGTMVSACPAA